MYLCMDTTALCALLCASACAGAGEVLKAIVSSSYHVRVESGSVNRPGFHKPWPQMRGQASCCAVKKNCARIAGTLTTRGRSRQRPIRGTRSDSEQHMCLHVASRRNAALSTVDLVQRIGHDEHSGQVIICVAAAPAICSLPQPANPMS